MVKKMSAECKGVSLIITMSDKLHLGCGKNILPDWINVDCIDSPGVDLVFDLDKCNINPFPLADNSIQVIWASHLLEHIANPLPMMQELYRIAQPDAKATFHLPYGSSDDAFEDPTHVRPYFLNSFSYFSQPYYWRADYGYRGDWKTETIVLSIPAAKHSGRLAEDIMDDIMSLRNIVVEMSVELTAIKPARKPLRELQEFPTILYNFI